jgi:hypothetical protein
MGRPSAWSTELAFPRAVTKLTASTAGDSTLSNNPYWLVNGKCLAYKRASPPVLVPRKKDAVQNPPCWGHTTAPTLARFPLSAIDE